MSKKRRTRAPREIPAWWKDVDRDMRLYLVWERVIKQQQNIILTHQLSGMRTTPVYQLREGSGGGEVIHQAERIAIDIEFAETKIATGEKYRADLEETVRIAAAGDPDKQTYIQRYWLAANLSVRARINLVLDALPFLGHREWGSGRVTGPNRTFYRWREQIYDALGELMGYRTDGE